MRDELSKSCSLDIRRTIAPPVCLLRGSEQSHFPPMFLKRILYYLNPVTLFAKSDPNVNMRFMHGINRISILMFLGCVILMAVRAYLR